MHVWHVMGQSGEGDRIEPELDVWIWGTERRWAAFSNGRGRKYSGLARRAGYVFDGGQKPIRPKEAWTS